MTAPDPFFAAAPRLAREVRRYRGIDCFLDLDGTLAPIAPTGAEAARAALAAVAAALEAPLASIPGCFLEDKGLSLSVHFRLTPRERVAAVRAGVAAAVRCAGGDGALVLREGKEVLEVRPARAAHKGTAVLSLMAHGRGRRWRGRYLPVYVGDDRTDEDAFRVLRGTGLTVRVGRGPTAAAYFVTGADQVPPLLAWLAGVLDDLVRPATG